jgi:hypothetical protein
MTTGARATTNGPLATPTEAAIIIEELKRVMTGL